MKQKWDELRCRISDKLSDPVMADRSMDLMSAVVWLSMAAWGVAAVITGIPTITMSTNPFYEIVWGVTLAIVGTIAGVAALSTFWFTADITLRIRRKRTEFASLMVLLGFTTVYPILLFVLALLGDTDRVASVFAAIPYMAVPAWRLRHLWKRIKKLQELRAEELAKRILRDMLGREGQP